MQVDTSVAEADVGQARSPAWRRPSPSTRIPSERFKGTVRQIRNAPQTVQNVVTYDAVIDVDNPDLKLKPGMTANVTFIYAEHDDVLRVPTRRCASARRTPRRGHRRAGGGKRGRGGAGARRPRRARPPGSDEPATAGPAGAARTSARVWVLRGDRAGRRCRSTVGVTDGTQREVSTASSHEGDGSITDAIDGERPRRRRAASAGLC